MRWWLLFLFACGRSAARPDGDDATLDTAAPADPADGDGDGVVYGDCDDADPRVAYGLYDVPYDGLDNDCSCGDVVDVDEDGFAALVAGGNDCADNDPGLYPGSPGHAERCPSSPDADGDGARVDCDDADAAVGPDQAEVPRNGVDDDCDGGDHFIAQADQHTFPLSEVPADGSLRVWTLTGSGGYGEGALSLEQCCASACFLYERPDPTTVTLPEYVPAVGAAVFITYDIAR